MSRSCGCGGRECACALRSGREQDSSAEVGRPAKVYRTPAARRVHAGGPPIPSSPPQVQAASGSEGRRPRFACPIPDCNGCYSSAQYLMTHIEGTHLSRPDSVNVVPETFLRAYQRWICHDMLIPWGKSCRSCHAPGPQLSCRRSKPGLLAPTVAEEVPPLAATTLVPANLLNQVDQLFSVKAGTLKHIPVPCRALWAEALTLSLQWLHERKDIEAAWVLVTLPRLVLGPVQRTGKKHNRQVTNVVMRRLHAWFLRDFARLTETALKGPAEKVQKPKAKMREAEDRLPRSLLRISTLRLGGRCSPQSATEPCLKPPNSSVPTHLPWTTRKPSSALCTPHGLLGSNCPWICHHAMLRWNLL